MSVQPKESFLDIIHHHLNRPETVLPAYDRSVKLIRGRVDCEEPDLEILEKLICRDPALVTQVLRVANSEFYAGLNKVSTIHSAIIRLGTGEIARIAGEMQRQDNMQIDDPFCRGIMQKLWQHAIGCAFGSHWLATKTGFGMLAQEAFIGGMLHDVGKFLLVRVVEEIFRSDQKGIRPSDHLLWEVLENFHSEHGEKLLEKWNLPATYTKIAREHHDEEPDPNDTILIMVRLVNRVCNKLGIGLQKDSSIILAATPEASLLGLSEVFLAKLEITLEDAPILRRDAGEYAL